MRRKYNFLLFTIDFKDWFYLEEQWISDSWYCWDEDCWCWDFEIIKNKKYKKVPLYKKISIIQIYSYWLLVSFVIWIIIGIYFK
jgi:hypothetical protein